MTSSSSSRPRTQLAAARKVFFTVAAAAEAAVDEAEKEDFGDTSLDIADGRNQWRFFLLQISVVQTCFRIGRFYSATGNRSRLFLLLLLLPP